MVRLFSHFCFSLCAAVFFTSCTQKNSNQIGLGYYGPKTPYESPFAERKMLLDFSEESASGDAPEKLVATIDNQCSDEACGTDKLSLQKLSCFLSKGAGRNTQLKEQAYNFTLTKGMSFEDLEKQIELDKCVIGVSEERKYRSTWAPNDPLYSQQRAYLDTIKWALGMNRMQGTSPFATIPLKPVKIAIIDSGVGAHPDLDGVVTERIDMRSPQSKAVSASCPTALTNLENPFNTHGTFVAGIIGGKSNNSIGLTGVARNVEIISIMIGNCKGEMSTAEVANAMGTAFSRGAEVINLSLGGANEPDPTFEFNLTQILNKKTVVVVSAGNEYKHLQLGNGLPKSYPASYAPKYPGVISVAWGKQDGTLQDGNKTNQGSNYGKDVVKILAPGDALISTMNPANAPGYLVIPTGFGRGSGSSFSAPLVTGAVALTIGFLKQNNLDFDERMVEDLILKTTSVRTDLRDLIQEGRILDFDKLIDTLLKLSATGVELPMTVSSRTMRYNTTDKASEVTFNLSWDVPFPHFGARLGIFDLSQGCNFSEPCRIQDFEMGALKGSRNIKLTRNETVPMVSSLQDPTFSVNLVAAIYYRVPNPDKAGKYKNIFGIDAKTSINLRDFEFSTSSSPLIGEVIQMRTDQDRLFINGWVCLQDSNKALRVELLDESGRAVPTDTAYEWPYMQLIPRGCENYTFDGGYESCGTGNGDRGVFPWVTGKVHQKNLGTNLAGLESTPLLMVDDPPDQKRPGCHTMTTNHGFEFIIPFETLITQNLIGKRLSVKAYHPNRAGITLTVPDQFGSSILKVPEIPYQKAGSSNSVRMIASNITLNRLNDSIRFQGKVCSRSPSPINVEITYSHWGLKCRLRNETGFPQRNLASSDPLIRFCISQNVGWPLVHDPSLTKEQNSLVYPDPDSPLQPRDANAVFSVFDWKSGLDAKSIEIWEKLITPFDPKFPNTSIVPPGPDANFSKYIQDIRSRGLIDIASGRQIIDVVNSFGTFSQKGVGFSDLARLHQAHRAQSGLRNIGAWDGRRYPDIGGRATLWDWYDVGEFYTPAIVAYDFDEATETGRVLKNDLLISKVMRETKKYETPLPEGYVFLSETQLTDFSKTASCFEFPVDYKIDNLARFSPALYGYFKKIIAQGGVYPQFLFNSLVTDAMKSLPVEIRLFQDGVLVEHLLSDFGSNTYRNTYFTTYEN